MTYLTSAEAYDHYATLIANYYFVNVNSVYMKALQRKVIMTLGPTES